MAILNSLSIRIQSLIEIIIELLAIFFYIWVLEPHAEEIVRISFFWLFCVGFPFICIGREQRKFPEFSLDWEHFVHSFYAIFYFTLVVTAFFIGMAFYFDSFNYDGQFALRVSEYVFWSFLQQIGLQVFLTRRLQNVFPQPLIIAVASGSIFSLIHFPNPALMILTGIGGIFWSYFFQKAPNLYLLALSHGWLAVMSLYCLPSAWLHHLRIGPTYWHF
ncbi:MAG: hypothetical protein A3I11_00445 [Elusimicrobia bacterium RIFCSPLOWO2_02_FULL_39_32]|nr:MAG: hypothetical protein A3B80_06425 [Elusimicrobia bacterium RIFCSPHIGHO2_02_FULL_39_36]OGR91593.1 MAG: hypothetical protein A3I11_00445 [Elusimicrobia bacterium RIFCSPLOWO2_02_FULL_39_32]OGR98820.1 MAG: hypothetical protein A3G85_08610 [Elusimicrobia bacterium RIFCSPLOWO2_12_FULL_39_28]